MQHTKILRERADSRSWSCGKDKLAPILKSQITLQDNNLKWTRHTDHIDQADRQTG